MATPAQVAVIITFQIAILLKWLFRSYQLSNTTVVPAQGMHRARDLQFASAGRKAQLRKCTLGVVVTAFGGLEGPSPLAVLLLSMLRLLPSRATGLVDMPWSTNGGRAIRGHIVDSI